MESRTFTCRQSDIRRVRVTCRWCGSESIAEIPQQLARGYMIHPCPKCPRVFELHQAESGKWEVKSLVGTLDDLTFQMGQKTSLEKDKKGD